MNLFISGWHYESKEQNDAHFCQCFVQCPLCWSFIFFKRSHSMTSTLLTTLTVFVSFSHMNNFGYSKVVKLSLLLVLFNQYNLLSTTNNDTDKMSRNYKHGTSIFTWWIAQQLLINICHFFWLTKLTFVIWKLAN